MSCISYMPNTSTSKFDILVWFSKRNDNFFLFRWKNYVLEIQLQNLKSAFKTITKILLPLLQPVMLKMLKHAKKCWMDKQDLLSISGHIKNPQRYVGSNWTKPWVLSTLIGYLAQKLAKKFATQCLKIPQKVSKSKWDIFGDFQALCSDDICGNDKKKMLEIHKGNRNW